MKNTASKTPLPELETEIAKLQAVNKILTDWLFYGGRNTPVDEAGKTRFDQFWILAPFAITDIEPLTKAIRQYRNHKELLPYLTKIKALAEANLKPYGEGENKEQVKRTMYYYENEGRIKRAISKGQEEDIEAHKNRQLIQFMFVVAGYCREVIAYISEPINILKKEKNAQKEAAKLKPLPHEGITSKQIALFFYYLRESKEDKRPCRAFFIKNEGHKKPPYKFTGSPIPIYDAYRILQGKNGDGVRSKVSNEDHEKIMNPNNLKAVIPYLKKYPAAHGKAKNDLYSMERG